MENKKLVLDYKGNLIPKVKSRNIEGKYYEEGISCFKINGKWYKITSPLITYDHYTKQYVLKNSIELLSGVINEKGELGSFSTNDYVVTVRERIGGHARSCLNEDIALAAGYVENLGDGIFYKKENVKEHLEQFLKKSIPQHERSSKYNLESDKEAKEKLIGIYNQMNIKISARARRIAHYIGDFTFGFEVEVIEGFLPKRIKNRLALKALKDGSLRHANGEGLEIVSMPMSGAKGVQVLIDTCKELTKRCEANSLCSFHIHFGKTRRDKIYILSLYSLISKIQQELKTYFPYSRFRSIRDDGKTYCNFLPDLKIGYKEILSCKEEEQFKKVVVGEFGKIYSWLNDGHILNEEYAPPKFVRQFKTVGGKKMFSDGWLKNIYTTKSIHHHSNGQKWEKHSRYSIVNFLNLFFNSIGTIEFRPAESSMNATKNLVWLIVYSSILKYAENIKVCLSDHPIKLEDILSANLPKKVSDSIIDYMKYRKKLFDPEKNWKTVEKNWHQMDLVFDENYKDLLI